LIEAQLAARPSGILDVMRAVHMTWLLVAGLAALACSQAEKPTPATSDALDEGRLIYLAQPCPTCHGHNRRGTNIGPPIRGLRRHWTARRLAAFLHDPASFKQTDPRLRTISEHYRTDMPSPILRDEKRADALIAYLLAE
jgi:cytochrome c2